MRDRRRGLESVRLFENEVGKFKLNGILILFLVGFLCSGVLLFNIFIDDCDFDDDLYYEMEYELEYEDSLVFLFFCLIILYVF